MATLNGHITFFDTKTSTQTGVIEGRKDLGSGRADADLITAKKSLEVSLFRILCQRFVAVVSSLSVNCIRDLWKT